MRIEYLQCLVKVVETGSINKAAQQLFRSQPAVSGAIKAIENELGYPVIIRTAQGVVPTKNGTQVVSDARIVLNYVDGWKHLSIDAKDYPEISIAYQGAIGQTALLQCVTDLRRSHPNIHIRLCPNHSILDDPSVFRIGIVLQTPDHFLMAKDFAKKNNLELDLLFNDEFVLFGNKNHSVMRSSESSVNIQSLKNQKIALPDIATNFPYIHLLTPLSCDYSIQLGDDENIAMAVAHNLALAIRPSSLAKTYYKQYLKDGIACMRRLTGCPMPVDIFLVRPIQAQMTNADRIVCDTIRRIYRSYRGL